MREGGSRERATFAAGCFWGVEAAFRALPGVVATRVGYTGGHTEAPTYEQVCGHGTGHAEAVELVYDPALVTYEQLLATFWGEHDPSRDRSGLALGDQYRSAIFVHSPSQRAVAEASRTSLEQQLGRPLATQIEDAQVFWEAEERHQRYFERHGRGRPARALVR